MEPFDAGSKLPEVAYYYSEPVWKIGDDEGNWIKNLILFFDGVALLVPTYIRDKPFERDPAIAGGLAARGLLKILEPETFIDTDAVTSLADRLMPLLEEGQFNHLATEDVRFEALSMSRLGYRASADLAERIVSELRSRGLARESADGVSIPTHPIVRSLILVLWSQLLRPTGRAHGRDLQPTTDNPGVHRALTAFLQKPSMPSSGHVVTLDLETVGVDLRAVPIDEVLDFRKGHRSSYRAYARNVRDFNALIGSVPFEERQMFMRDRREEISEAAESLRRSAESAWKSPSTFALGFVGAVWTALQGDLVGAMLAGGQTIIGSSGGTEVAAFSYLFDARRQFNA